MSKTAAKDAALKDEGALVAKTGGTDLAALQEDLGDEQGLGVSTSSDDNTVPYMKLLQDNTPEVKKRDPAYVEGAEPGCLLNTATRELWIPHAESGFLYNAKGEQLFFQPAVFQRAVVEWVPRDLGGGRVATTPHTLPTIEETFLSVGGKQVAMPGDSTGRRMIWVNDAKNELKDTRYHFVNIVREGYPEPVILSFSGTGHRTSQGWMTFMKNSRLPNGQRPHAWFKKYPVRSVERSDNNNTWFVLQFDDGEWILDKAMREAGKQVYESVNAGKLRAAAEEPSEGGAGSAAADAI